MLMRLKRLVDRVAQRLGGPRVLALPLIRTLAVLAIVTWSLLSPTAPPGWDAVDTTVLAFVLYSAAVETALWFRPGTTLGWNVPVLLVDQAFALTLIWETGGARSGLYLALPLIAALHSYYYGIRRGITVAATSAVAYLVVVWPTIEGIEVGNVAIRLVALLGTAVGVGVLADVEERERLKAFDMSLKEGK